MTQKPLSERQEAILHAVRERTQSLGYPPSVREIARAVGLASPSTVKHHLDALERRGLIQREAGRPRALGLTPKTGANTVGTGLPGAGSAQVGSADVELIDGRLAGTDSQSPNRSFTPPPTGVPTPAVVANVDRDVAQVPLVGRIAAGAPITAEQYVEDVFALPTRLTGNGELFLLEVRGDSMIEAAICDGDYVVIRAQADAANGEIVAALIDDEATIKVLSQTGGHRWLLPRNDSYSPIPADEARILGKVVTLIRGI